MVIEDKDQIDITNKNSRITATALENFELFVDESKEEIV